MIRKSSALTEFTHFHRYPLEKVAENVRPLCLVYGLYPRHGEELYNLNYIIE